MREIIAPNIWAFHKSSSWVVVPTNGTVTKNGRAVMGRGIAQQAAKNWPDMPRMLGVFLRNDGNHPVVFNIYALISFPVKHNWWEDADLDLIEQSARELMALLHKIKATGDIYIPQVGCGNGNLRWEDVKPRLSCLDDQFILVRQA
jgi:hypothetical protein